MTMRLLLLSLSVAAIWSASAQVNIPVANASFEDDTLFCAPQSPCSYEPGITGWLCGPFTGVFKPSPIQFPNGIPAGVNVAAVGNQIVTGSISQLTKGTVKANKTYTLTLSIGARADYPFTGYVAILSAGGVVLSSDSTLSPAPGTFLKDVIVYKSGPAPEQAGEPLTIAVKSLGSGQVEVDDVSLTVQ